MIVNRSIIGILLVIVYAVSVVQLVSAGVSHVITAFCYLGILVAAIGFLANRTAPVYSYASVALVAQIPFSVDLIRVYMGLEQLIGLVQYDPANLTRLGRILDVTVHLFILPIVLYGLRYMKVPEKSSFLRWHAFLLVIFVAISYYAGTNCIRMGCFEPLYYGSIITGHIFYLIMIAIVLPLAMAHFLAKFHGIIIKKE